MNGESDQVAGAPAPLEMPLAMPGIYKDFTVCDLTTQTEDGRYMARAAVVGRGGRTLSQRFLDFETFDTEAQANARAQAGALAWIDDETRYVPLALPMNPSQVRHASSLTRHSAVLAENWPDAR